MNADLWLLMGALAANLVGLIVLLRARRVTR